MPLFHFHGSRGDFYAIGSEVEAETYLAHLNRSRVLDPWSARPVPKTPGKKPRGLQLSQLLADHVAANHAANAATGRLLRHGN